MSPEIGPQTGFKALALGFLAYGFSWDVWQYLKIPEFYAPCKHFLRFGLKNVLLAHF